MSYSRTGFSLNIFGPVIFALITLSFIFVGDGLKVNTMDYS